MRFRMPFTEEKDNKTEDSNNTALPPESNPDSHVEISRPPWFGRCEYEELRNRVWCFGVSSRNGKGEPSGDSSGGR